MKRRMRCNLNGHKWVVKQDSKESPRYYGCLYCDYILEDANNRSTVDLSG
jgi:hypothetical protein